MTKYKTPLPALFAAVLESAINRVLALDPDAVQRLSRLQKRLLRIDLDGLGISLFFSFEYGAVLVSVDADRDADTVVTGSPVALFMMAAPDEVSEWGMAESDVRIQGDANLARELGKVFSQMELDWEGPLSAIVGDTLGFQLASGLKRGASAAKTAAQTTASQFSEYVGTGQGPVIGRSEMRGFKTAVDELNKAIARTEARLSKLEGQDV